MIDDERPLPVESADERARYAESLLYDHSKFMTTLSLIALGGVLSLTEAAGDGEIRPWKIGLVIGTIAAAGVLALTTANALVNARASGVEPSKRLPLQIKASMACIGIGLGAFLQMWWQTLQ